MDESLKWLQEIIQLFTGGDCSEKELLSRCDGLKEQYQRLSTGEKTRVFDILKQSYDTETVIYFLSLIIKFMDIEEMKREILSVVLAGDFDCYTTAMLEHQMVTNLDGADYAQLRKIHDKSVAQFERKLDMCYPYIPLENRNRKRIVIITEQILNILHAPTKLVMDFAYVMQKQFGMQVLLFVLPSDYLLSEDIYYSPKKMISLDKFENEKMVLKYKDIFLEGYQINMSSPGAEKEYNMMLSMIYAWNPYFVLHMGVFNPVADVVRRITTVAAMGMTMECPVTNADIIIRYTEIDAKEEDYVRECGKRKQFQLFHRAVMPVVQEESGKTFHREELALPEDKFLIAVVGNRLDTEIDEEFLTLMKQILERASDTAFVIIGDVSKMDEFFGDSIFDDKVFYLGFCKDLQGVYGTVDLYLNPKRIGGGFSSSLALQAGVPIVTMPDCDVAKYAGDDFIVDDYSGMLERVCRLAMDSSYYDSLKSKIIQNGKATENELEEYISGFIQNIIDIVDGKIK